MEAEWGDVMGLGYREVRETSEEIWSLKREKEGVSLFKSHNSAPLCF